MDTQSGRFVDEEHAKPDMNRYSAGDIIVVDGDEFEIMTVANVDGRGRLILKALSADDRRAQRLGLESPRAAPNRHERRKREAQLRKTRNAAKRDRSPAPHSKDCTP